MGEKRLYDLRAWRRNSKAYLAAHPLCAACETAGKLTAATQVDHIVPLKRGGNRFDWDGLQGLCDACHATKTLIDEQGKQRAGVSVDGTPLSPNHWWNRND